MSVNAVKWLGICDLCDQPSPAEEAQRDVDQSPCRKESDDE